MRIGVWDAYERRFRPFSDDEAWSIFRLAAFGEAIGWTLLLIGLGSKRFLFHGNNAPVLITGQIHGTLFLLYATAAVLLYPSLGWNRRQAIVAGLASVPPYGSLLYERFAAHRRQKADLRATANRVTYAFVTQEYRARVAIEDSS